MFKAATLIAATASAVKLTTKAKHWSDHADIGCLGHLTEGERGMVNEAFDHINENGDKHLDQAEGEAFVGELEHHFDIDFHNHMDAMDHAALEAGLEMHTGEHGMSKKQMFNFMNSAVDYINHRTGHCAHEAPNNEWAHDIADYAHENLAQKKGEEVAHPEEHEEKSGTASHSGTKLAPKSGSASMSHSKSGSAPAKSGSASKSHSKSGSAPAKSGSASGSKSASMSHSGTHHEEHSEHSGSAHHEEHEHSGSASKSHSKSAKGEKEEDVEVKMAQKKSGSASKSHSKSGSAPAKSGSASKSHSKSGSAPAKSGSASGSKSASKSHSKSGSAPAKSGSASGSKSAPKEE